MKIAGQTACICPLFSSTEQYFRAYLTADRPDFSVTVTQENLDLEQAWLDEEADSEGLRRRQFTGPFLERAAIQRAFAEHLLLHDTVMLHGSTVAVDGRAYLFTARCGTGKSTHTRLWREVFGSRAVMINDDKPFLRIKDGVVTAFGAPWSGKHGLDSNINAPLQGICILDRGADNRILPISAGEALQLLLHQSYQPFANASRVRNDALVIRVAETVPLWRMTCNRLPQAAQIAYDAMSSARTKMPPSAADRNA